MKLTETKEIVKLWEKTIYINAFVIIFITIFLFIKSYIFLIIVFILLFIGSLNDIKIRDLRKIEKLKNETNSLQKKINNS